MNPKEIEQFFQNLGEIWRDITALEFLMRCAIAKDDNELDKFPLPPYEEGKIYDKYPKSFKHLSFEIVTTKFNSRFPKLTIPEEVIQLRDAMAHGLIAEINNNGLIQLVKFKENKESKQLIVEFSLTLEQQKIAQLKQSLMELRRYIALEIDENTSANK